VTVRKARWPIVAALILGVTTACGGGATTLEPATSKPSTSVEPSASTLATPEPSTSVEPSASVLESAAPTPSVSPETTASAAEQAQLGLDTMAEVRADGLSLRAEPRRDAAAMGTLPNGEPAYVVGGPSEADGYVWYQLASVRQAYRGDCGDPAPAPSLACSPWLGWAAAITPEGDAWLAPRTIECPTTLDTDAYLALLPAERLACADDRTWTLTVYLPPETLGRGCYPVWMTAPGWLDGSCNFVFPQPVESHYDSDDRLQPSVHPDLGACGLGDEPSCPFDALKGAWIEMVGHLDDPAARTCTSELSSNFAEAPYPPPDSDLVVFACRTRLVVTAIRAVAAPDA